MGRQYAEQIVPGMEIRASHIMSLRTYINEDAALVPPSNRYSFSWLGVGPNDFILAKHLMEMRSAIQLLWNFKSRGAIPAWTGGVAPAGPSTGQSPTPILASHIVDLRAWLNQYEDNHSPSGVSSVSYFPNSSTFPLVTDAWAENIRVLSTQHPPPVRTVIYFQNGNAPLSQDGVSISRYKSSFRTYKNKGIEVYPVFNLEFMSPSSSSADQQPNYAFSSGSFHNAYILNFASQVGIVANNFMSDSQGALIRNLIIWNEPNDTAKPEKYLDANHFAAMLWNARQHVPQEVKLLWGGVVFGPGYRDGSNNPHTDPVALQYVKDVYNAISSRGLAGPSGTSWPWDGMNIHIHNVRWAPDRTAQSVAKIFSDINEFKAGKDDNTIMVGEWGVNEDEYAADPSSMVNLFNWLKPYAGQPFFFSHSVQVQEGEVWKLVDQNEIPGPPGGPGSFVVANQSPLPQYTTFDTLIGS